jgi:hypothetical protein
MRITEEELNNFIYKHFCIVPCSNDATSERIAIIKIVSELKERRDFDKEKKNTNGQELL